ncbi:regulatory LuxR family protein [Rhodobacter viridis]|uniref:Regulatory LuxR family protein n=1 Tax=Rhodobacter viridis TaxID=1054202 RepID=A0A318U2F1_9RHOB|nr:LuxR C-terminal-related transcriptional regulator [Rhodobacter viridis]PYF09459.1 regulatory LuxR family protein [Rhodobacter viridis]
MIPPLRGAPGANFDRARPPARVRLRWVWTLALFLFQLVCAAVFLTDMLSSLFDFRATPISWSAREMLELGAACGLLGGLGLAAWLLADAVRSRHLAEDRLRRVAGDFGALLQERFTEWGLTAAERDVALFVIKGFTTCEIAGLRKTSEGTVKAQTAAIYRKAEVMGRSQLLSLFIDELLVGLPGPERSPAEPPIPFADRAERLRERR